MSCDHFVDLSEYFLFIFFVSLQPKKTMTLSKVCYISSPENMPTIFKGNVHVGPNLQAASFYPLTQESRCGYLLSAQLSRSAAGPSGCGPASTRDLFFWLPLVFPVRRLLQSLETGHHPTHPPFREVRRRARLPPAAGAHVRQR